MSTTAPVIWITRPVALVGAVLVAVFVAVAMLSVPPAWVRQRACAPVAISIISRVMLAWRILL